MGIGTWKRLAQLQLVTFKIFIYKISKEKRHKKIYSLVQNKKKKFEKI